MKEKKIEQEPETQNRAEISQGYTASQLEVTQQVEPGLFNPSLMSHWLHYMPFWWLILLLTPLPHPILMKQFFPTLTLPLISSFNYEPNRDVIIHKESRMGRQDKQAGKCWGKDRPSSQTNRTFLTVCVILPHPTAVIIIFHLCSSYQMQIHSHIHHCRGKSSFQRFDLVPKCWPKDWFCSAYCI